MVLIYIKIFRKPFLVKSTLYTEKWDVFPLRFGNMANLSTLTLVVYNSAKNSSFSTKARKRVERHWDRKGKKKPQDFLNLQIALLCGKP